MSEKTSLLKYVHTANEWLKANKKCSLTSDESIIILEHLQEVARNYNPSIDETQDMTSLLCLETTMKVSEIHPEVEVLTRTTASLARELYLRRMYEECIGERER